MKRVMFALVAATVLTASSSGCCCLDRLFFRPWGCCANRCSACDGSACGGGGCGGGCCGGASNCGNSCDALGPVGSGWTGWGAWRGWNGGWHGGCGSCGGGCCANNGYPGPIGGLPGGGPCNCPNCMARKGRGVGPGAPDGSYVGGPGGYANGAGGYPGGPPSGQVAYPYYTTRGPRDFLAKNPPSIGP